MKKDFIELIDLVLNNDVKLNKVVTNRYKWTDGPQALADFSENADKMLKVVLDFTQ